MSMSIEEAIRILDPETSADAIAEIEYYAGFNRDKPIEKVNEACAIACDVMKRYLKLLHKLIDSIQPKRKIQYYDSGKQYHTYMVKEERNPCGCGSNCYHLEYDGEKIYGVCNACDTDIYEIKDEYVKEKLNQGIWK